jgi:spoIIIJ-associated protein
MKDKELIKLVTKEVDKLCDLLSVDAERSIVLEESDDGEIKYIKIKFEGEELGYMIGKRGRHLDSLQYVLQIMVGRLIDDEEFPFRVFVDVGDYRKEIDDRLATMAIQKADDARILGEEVELEPMRPSDRRIVHLTLQQFDDITTESRGEGRDRHIVIVPA